MALPIPHAQRAAALALGQRFGQASTDAAGVPHQPSTATPPSALPQPRGALLAGAPPELVTGMAPATPELMGELPARLAGPWGMGDQWARDPMPVPVRVTGRAPPARQPLGRPATVVTDPHSHPTATTPSAPTRAWDGPRIPRFRCWEPLPAAPAARAAGRAGRGPRARARGRAPARPGER